MPLRTEPRLDDRDYAALVDAHRGRSREDSERINAKLVLLLANHIGDRAVLEEAITHALRQDAEAAPASSG